MQANKTVTINGRTYDAVTGLPVEPPKRPVQQAPKPVARAPKRTPQAAATVHSSTQRSQTLNRRVVKKHTIAKRPQPGTHMDIARNSQITRFAKHPETIPKKEQATPDRPAKTHPVAKAAHRRIETHKAAAAPTSKQVKDAAISAALAAPTKKQKLVKEPRFKWTRKSTIIVSVLAVLMLGATITYINIPSISVAFAASQAGIAATYPEYRPDGYSLKQPVTYRDGEVTLTFASNTTNVGYTIVQTRSSWDSSAVLDNVVRKAVGDNYVTTQERGLTIYSYENNAAWVNGGILYTIASTAPLSGEQIRHIATSL